MRAGLVGIFCFVALLALGHYVAAPFFCRGGFAIPTLDSRVFCGADLHLNRSGSMLLYFGSIAIAFVFGAIAGALPGKHKAEPQPGEKAAGNAAETFEQILAAEEKKQAAASPAGSGTPAAPAGVSAEKSKTSTASAPADTASVKKEPAQTDAKKSGDAKKPDATPGAATAADAITAGLSAAKNGIRGPFEGTNQELIAHFRELKKQEGVNSIAQAQRLLDESTVAALAKGVEPKQHLSEIAHLVLAEDPDLQSGVVRGVVVHIAARLKELGVANKLPAATKGAA